MPHNPNAPDEGVAFVGSGGGIATTPFPTPPGIGPTDSPFIVIQKYRAAMAHFVGEFHIGISRYIDDFARVAKPSHYRDSVLDDPTSDEVSVRSSLLTSAQDLLTQSNPIIDAMLSILTEQLVTDRPSIDVQALVDKILLIIDLELAGNADISIFRGYLKTLINTIMLDSAFDLLATDTTEIDTAVNNFKTNAKSQLDDKTQQVGAQTIAYLQLRGIWLSDVGAEAIARINAKNGRQYTEIDAQAEQMRIQMLHEAYNRAFERWKVRVSAHQTIPIDLFRLSPTLAQILNTIIDKQFPDPVAFLNQLPGLLGQGLASLAELARLLQNDRKLHTDVDAEADRTLVVLLQTIAATLGNVANGLGKLGTFEAS